MTKVSIVINCFNGETFLEKCLNSALSQDYENFEIIFWDNCSTDKSFEIVSKISSEKIRLYRSSKNLPLSEARRLALDKCLGEWVGFLDVDDEWDSNKLSKQVSLLDKTKADKNNNVGIISSLAKIIDDEGVILARNIGRPPSWLNVNLVLQFTNPFIFQTLLFKLDILKSNWGDRIFYYCPDYHIIMKILLKYDLSHINEELASYRIHSSNLSKKLSEEIYQEPLDALRSAYLEKPNTSNIFIFAKIRLVFFKLKEALAIISNVKFVTLIAKLFYGFIFWILFGGGRIKLKTIINTLCKKMKLCK